MCSVTSRAVPSFASWPRPVCLHASAPFQHRRERKRPLRRTATRWGFPARPLGDGFLVRHGYATENTWYNPGWLHTGEDWYLPEGETGGMGVYAVAAGEVVFAGSEYPGLVVIIEHPDGLFSMYGHLDYALAVEAGQTVERGQLLGPFSPARTAWLRATSTSRCGPSSPHPRSTGMRPATGSPAVSTARPVPATGRWTRRSIPRPWAGATRPTSSTAAPGRTACREGCEVVVSEAAPESTPLWTAPADVDDAESLGDLALSAGDRYPLLAVDAGEEASPARAPRRTGSGIRSRCQTAARVGSRRQSPRLTTLDRTAGRHRCGSISCLLSPERRRQPFWAHRIVLSCPLSRSHPRSDQRCCRWRTSELPHDRRQAARTPAARRTVDRVRVRRPVLSLRGPEPLVGRSLSNEHCVATWWDVHWDDWPDLRDP